MARNWRASPQEVLRLKRFSCFGYFFFVHLFLFFELYVLLLCVPKKKIKINEKLKKKLCFVYSFQNYLKLNFSEKCLDVFWLELRELWIMLLGKNFDLIFIVRRTFRSCSFFFFKKPKI